MNWLAHLLLSEPSPEFRLGNLLPDFMRVARVDQFAGDFRRGVECHRRIDAFTDCHPVVRQSKERIPPPFRRYAGILVDVFYDHVLSRDWAQYSEVPVRELLSSVYQSFDTHRLQIPEPALERLELMRTEDWLGSYHEIAGVRNALERMSKRLRRPVNLSASADCLDAQYELFREDFRAFFPELQQHVKIGSHERSP